MKTRSGGLPQLDPIALRIGDPAEPADTLHVLRLFSHLRSLGAQLRDLDAMLAQLRAKGADVAEETQDMDGVGRFGWVTDPEGNRVELWQPA